jgi:hypothetical protein
MPDEPKKKPYFNINIEIDDTFFQLDLWPDGDAPENPTLDDVIKLIQKDGGPDRVAQDWNLLDGLAITVSNETGHRTIIGPGAGTVINSYDSACSECGGKKERHLGDLSNHKPGCKYFPL